MTAKAKKRGPPKMFDSGIRVNLPTNVHDRVREAARDALMPQSQWIRHVVIERLKQEGRLG